MASSDAECESDLEEQARSLTTCSICMDQFTNPKVLPCHHTFCLVCLKNCYESVNKTRLIAVSNFPCPTCRKTCYVSPQGLEALPTDFRIAQILDLMSAIESSLQSQQKSKTKQNFDFGNCSICRFQRRERHSEGFCLQCEKAFCSQCLSHHGKTKIFQDHVVLNDKQFGSSDSGSQNKDPEKCGEHDADYKYFCEDCSTLLCTVCCLFSEHNSHSIKEKSSAVSLYTTQLAAMESDLKSKLAKTQPMKEQYDEMKKVQMKNYEECESDIKAAAKQAVATIEKMETQLLMNLINNHDNSMHELSEVSSKLNANFEMCQKNIELVSQLKSQPGSRDFFVDFNQIKQSVSLMPSMDNIKPAIQPDTFKFVLNLNVSLGTLVKNKKVAESTATASSSSNQSTKEHSVRDQQIMRKESFNNKENKSENLRFKRFDPLPKPAKISKLQVSTSTLNIDQPPPNLNSTLDRKDSLTVPKQEAPDKIIKTLSRRLSGRLSRTALQTTIATSPSRKKLHWVAEGFSQCRDCCFMKLADQWLVVACDYKATNAADRIKAFDLKGNLHHAINTRQVVEPWSIIFQSSGNSIIVTDHASRAIKRIQLDESGKCSRVLTMSQSYLDRPTGISMTRCGDYVVTDSGNRPHRLAVYFQTSNYVERKLEFGNRGKGDSEVGLSNYVVVDHRDRVIVSDIEERHVKVFSAEDGSQILKFSCSCSFDGTKEMEPQGVAVDDANNIFVADQAMRGIAMFSGEGQLINNVVSTKGSPWGLAYLDELRILAAATDKGLEVFEL
ncbi:hypothetical protein HELRODRAFT_175087 [Helobdella robusta]|uniref:RING-type domain-containing protein n=1 Tax=Helobdella robusta TaxID=6412 RepID=T1F8U2_HELRO|nr:hypothetical protein HELRODRAFT_175087 [Helobdella robusta]ESO01060.1 hypothetical protein HELRODRAFT_175087 [Helobdella robusta]